MLVAGRRAHRRGRRPDRRRERRAGAAGAGPGRPRAAQRFGRASTCDTVSTDGVRRGRESRHRPGRAALAGARGLAGGLRGEPAGRRRRRPARPAGRCGWPTACSTWSATGSRRSWSASSCSNASPRRRRAVDRTRAAARPGPAVPRRRARRRRARPAAAGGGGERPAAGSRCWPAGPGTGKTTTVARMLALLHDQPGPPPRIALAAPTGKAAARLEEAVRAAAAGLGPRTERTAGRPAVRRPCTGCWAGARTAGAGSVHDASNQLPHDVVVVDEMSMVSLTLMARLLEAVRPTARLMLVGDPDQLSSVEAGAVLADIARAPGPAGRAAGAGRWPSSERLPRTSLPPVHGVVQLSHDLAVRRRHRRPRPSDPGGRSRRGAGGAALRLEPTCGSSRSTSRRIRTCGPSPPRRAGRAGRGAGSATLAAARAGDVPGALAGAGRAPAALRPPARAVRGRPVERGGRALAGRGHPGLRRGRRVVPRPAAAGHRQRLRDGPLQRRHRRHRRDPGRRAAAAFARGAAADAVSPRSGWTRSRPCTR